MRIAKISNDYGTFAVRGFVMINLDDLIEQEIENGYGDMNARAKVCQDLILKSISSGRLSKNVTIKGGVVMREKTKNIRRATQDIDIDFIRYSIQDESIDKFIKTLNCLDGIKIVRKGDIEALKQQDYKGKRVFIEISDSFGNKIPSKIDFGVHNKLNIEQEEFCFDIAFDDEGASLLINTNEQMFTEKLRSLLRLGSVSTRFKDIFDMYYLCKKIDKKRLFICMDTYIYQDSEMRENDIQGVLKRIRRTFDDEKYLERLNNSDKKWLDVDVREVVKELLNFLKKCK